MMRIKVATYIKAFIWGLVPVLWVMSALYLDRFQLGTEYRAGLLILYMLTISVWGVAGGIMSKHDESLILLIRNAVPIALISYAFFFIIYCCDAYAETWYYNRAGDDEVARLSSSAWTGFQVSMLFIGAPFLLGYIPGKLISVVYRRICDRGT